MKDLMDGGANGNFHREQILDKHNYLRSLESGSGWNYGAVFMNRLAYDTQLEVYAKNYAHSLCSTGHWGHSSRGAPYRVAPGENLYVNTVDYSNSGAQSFDSALVVKKWWDERENMNWNAADPNYVAESRGKMIGHWTQVVRAEASYVGCWIVTGCQCNNCGKENGGKWSTYMACHYDFGNRGWFPYWPLAYPRHIPSNVPNERRTRCGSCPKGFERCGTTAGEAKRDAYLCVGFWNINRPAPSKDLLNISIQERHKNKNLPTWKYMIRSCSAYNGGCPTGSSCWNYGNNSFQTEPKILTNQCLCNGFSASKSMWFERNICAVYAAVSGFPVNTYLGFIEKSNSDKGDKENDVLYNNNNNSNNKLRNKRHYHNNNSNKLEAPTDTLTASYNTAKAVNMNDNYNDDDTLYYVEPYYDYDAQIPLTTTHKNDKTTEKNTYENNNKNADMLEHVDTLIGENSFITSFSSSSISTEEETAKNAHILQMQDISNNVRDEHEMKHLFELKENSHPHPPSHDAHIQTYNNNHHAAKEKSSSNLSSFVTQKNESENIRGIHPSHDVHTADKHDERDTHAHTHHHTMMSNNNLNEETEKNNNNNNSNNKNSINNSSNSNNNTANVRKTNIQRHSFSQEKQNAADKQKDFASGNDDEVLEKNTAEETPVLKSAGEDDIKVSDLPKDETATKEEQPVDMEDISVVGRALRQRKNTATDEEEGGGENDDENAVPPAGDEQTDKKVLENAHPKDPPTDKPTPAEIAEAVKHKSKTEEKKT